MFGLGWKVSILFAVAGVGTWVWMDYKLTQEKLKVAQLTTANVILKENAEKLQAAADEQKQTMDALIKQTDKNGDRVYELTQQINSIRQEASQKQRELENLRQTEAADALNNPYNRGLAADARIRKLMQSISGPTSAPEG